MTMESHLAELERRHKALKDKIEKEAIHPACDDGKLHEWKKEKLLLKDEIAKLRVGACATLH